MTGQIDSSWLHSSETKRLTQVVEPLRFVGGCVRDALLGRKGSDIDAATPLTPDKVMSLLKAAGLKAIPTGIDHGTVTAVIDGRHFEVTTLRRDVSTDGRHATVAFTDDWKEDASRRDFTMNALYCDANGRLFDYWGGVEDAAAGRVRFIGDAGQRIREDALRILRFFRFFAHYGRDPVDADGLKACGELAGLIEKLSGERIQQEMLKLLVADRAAQAVGLMQRHGVWPHVVKAVVKAETLDRLPAELRKAQHAPDPLLSLALLLRSASGGGELVGAVAGRWKLSRAHHNKLVALCDEKEKWHTADDREGKKQIRAWGKELFVERALLAMAEGAEESSALAAIRLAREWEIPRFPVTGDDLISRGVKPGRELGEKLKAMEEKWEEEGYAAGKEELLNTVG